MESSPQWLSITAGILVLIVGFLFHWVGQLISILNWGLATRLGLQEKIMLPEHRAYEHGTAVADVLVGWVYPAIGVGLMWGADWSYKLAWIPGAILTYHAFNHWFWEMNRRREGLYYFNDVGRIAWFVGNLATGGLCLYLAWMFG